MKLFLIRVIYTRPCALQSPYPAFLPRLNTKKGDSHYLVDGGVVNPLPLNQIEAQEGHKIVAVDINGPGEPPSLMKEEKEESSWLNINWPFFKKDSNTDPGVFDVVQSSYEHMQNRLIKRDIEQYQPDVFIQIPRSTCGVFDFHRSQELIAVGHKPMRITSRINDSQSLSY